MEVVKGYLRRWKVGPVDRLYVCLSLPFSKICKHFTSLSDQPQDEAHVQRLAEAIANGAFTPLPIVAKLNAGQEKLWRIEKHPRGDIACVTLDSEQRPFVLLKGRTRLNALTYLRGRGLKVDELPIEAMLFLDNGYGDDWGNLHYDQTNWAMDDVVESVNRLADLLEIRKAKVEPVAVPEPTQKKFPHLLPWQDISEEEKVERQKVYYGPSKVGEVFLSLGLAQVDALAAEQGVDDGFLKEIPIDDRYLWDSSAVLPIGERPRLYVEQAIRRWQVYLRHTSGLEAA